MSTSTSTTGTTSTGAQSTVRPRSAHREHVVAVQFGAWGPQEVAVRAYSSGGRGGSAVRRRPGRDVPDLWARSTRT